MSGVGGGNGQIAHAAAKTGDGLLIVNLWQSKEGSEAAAQDPRRGEVLQQGGVDPDQIGREHHEVANYEIFD